MAEKTVPSKASAAASQVAKPTGWARPFSEINEVIRKAEDGNASAMAEVKEMLARAGTADILGGNVAQEALKSLIARYASKSPVLRECVTGKLQELRAELRGSSPSPLEKLLVERVLAAWLHLHHLESQYAGKESFSLDLGMYYQRVISAAQKRYLAAIKGLAEVRKLALPALQVNIAKKQVNVSGTAVNAG